MSEFKNIFILLRLHFSLFLLPVFLFGASQIPIEFTNRDTLIILFFVLHLLVYPSSNAYNSYIDKDTTPIGGVENPPLPGKDLFWVTIAMDIVSLAITFLFINTITGLMVLTYILVSRAYSSRLIRLKKYSLIGFLTVFIFQGAWIFIMVLESNHVSIFHPEHLISLNGSKFSVFKPEMEHYIEKSLIASLLIGAMYPLTQIYQHEADRNDGINTISMKLGLKGTFFFSVILYLLAIGLIFLYLNEHEFIAFTIINFPVVVYFLWWAFQTFKNKSAANFKNAYRMNIISGVCNIVCFSTLIYLNYFKY